MAAGTFREYYQELLVEHGCWPDEATAILDKVAADTADDESMRRLWNDHTDAFPASLRAVVWIRIKKAAIEYIESTKPKHFALAILKDD